MSSYSDILIYLFAVMKRRLSFAALSAFLLAGVLSCEESPLPDGITQLGGGNYLKTIPLNLSSAETRSTDGANETDIKNATVFVYQNDGSGEVLYEKLNTTSGSVDAQLYFNDATDFTYRFEAYANMGELESAPAEVRFTGESKSSLQMHGELGGIDSESTSSATISMERYISRVMVSSVSLNWKNAGNAGQPFTLKRIYLANTAQTLGGAAYYNVGGVQTAGDKDALLVSEVDAVIPNKGSYSVPRYLYAYGAEGSALVLECEWAGSVMYYHLDLSLTSNGSTAYTLNIHQTGSDTPLGSLTDDALESVGAMLAADWNEVSNEASFGEAPAPEVSILGTDGKFYSASSWTASGKSNDEAVGVAVNKNGHSFVIHPTAEQESTAWSSNTSVQIDGVFITTDRATAESDFAGEANTAAILAAVQAGTIADAPAAQYAAGITFANGKKGYLPSTGELTLCYTVLSDINSCMTAIGGTKFDMAVKPYWSSTQYSTNYAWLWNSGIKDVSYHNKTNTYTVRVVSAL